MTVTGMPVSSLRLTVFMRKRLAIADDKSLEGEKFHEDPRDDATCTDRLIPDDVSKLSEESFGAEEWPGLTHDNVCSCRKEMVVGFEQAAPHPCHVCCLLELHVSWCSAPNCGNSPVIWTFCSGNEVEPPMHAACDRQMCFLFDSVLNLILLTPKCTFLHASTRIQEALHWTLNIQEPPPPAFDLIWCDKSSPNKMSVVSDVTDFLTHMEETSVAIHSNPLIQKEDFLVTVGTLDAVITQQLFVPHVIWFSAVSAFLWFFSFWLELNFLWKHCQCWCWIWKHQKSLSSFLSGRQMQSTFESFACLTENNERVILSMQSKWKVRSLICLVCSFGWCWSKKHFDCVRTLLRRKRMCLLSSTWTCSGNCLFETFQKNWLHFFFVTCSPGNIKKRNATRQLRGCPTSSKSKCKFQHNFSCQTEFTNWAGPHIHNS